MAFKMTGFSGFKENEDKKKYKHPSPEQQIEMAKKASEKSGKDLSYDRRLSEIDGAPRFS